MNGPAIGDGSRGSARAAATFEQVPIEEVRRFWDRRPCNIRHSQRELGSREYFDEVEARKYRVEPHIPAFADFPAWRGRRVLEVGCGLGTETINFARAGAEVTAVDLSRRSLDLARRRAEVCGPFDVRFVQADAEHLADHLAGEQFDLVWSFGVLHHTPHPARALAGIRSLVAPGGTLKIMLYHRMSWKVLCLAAAAGPRSLGNLDAAVAVQSEAQSGCPVTWTYTRNGAVRLLRDTGFRVREATVEHIFPWRIPDYVEHRWRRNWWFRWMPRPLFRALERTFGWHLLLTATPA